jgi:hypothetical protein
VRALGLMSGTSMDGVDAAVVDTDGETITGFGPSGFREYTPDERARLRAGLGRWPGDAGLDGIEVLVRDALKKIPGCGVDRHRSFSGVVYFFDVLCRYQPILTGERDASSHFSSRHTNQPDAVGKLSDDAGVPAPGRC